MNSFFFILFFNHNLWPNPLFSHSVLLKEKNQTPSREIYQLFFFKYSIMTFCWWYLHLNPEEFPFTTEHHECVQTELSRSLVLSLIVKCKIFTSWPVKDDTKNTWRVRYKSPFRRFQAKVTAVHNCQLKCSIDVSAASIGEQKHPINVTDDLWLLLAALVQLDSDSWDVGAYSLGVPASVPPTPGGSTETARIMRLKGKSPLSSGQLKGTVWQFWSRAGTLCCYDKMRELLLLLCTSSFMCMKTVVRVKQQVSLYLKFKKCISAPLKYSNSHDILNVADVERFQPSSPN